ncbi:hypothetical protein SAMN06297387_1251, partial [Streptomyces zhaozhouensis]
MPGMQSSAGEGDVEESGFSSGVFDEGVGEDDEGGGEDDPGEGAADDEDDDAEDGDDDLADVDEGVPVIGGPFDGLLPPAAVLDAGVGGLVDVAGALACGFLAHLFCVEGELACCGQAFLGVVDPVLGGAGGGFGGLL